MVLLHGVLVSYVIRKRGLELTLASLKRNNQTELFEDNQRDLERAVENLGYFLEQNPEPENIAKLRADITNQSVSLPLNYLKLH